MPLRFALIVFSIACLAASYSVADVRLGLPPVISPEGNSQTASKIDLGRRLFFDKNLSADRKTSCASCHNPKKAFSDGRQFPVGLNSSAGTRNTPALANVAFASSLFWDGRSISLEQLATKPLLNKFEHGLESEQKLLDIVRRDRAYQTKLKQTFGVGSADVKVSHISAALASFQRSLLSATAHLIVTSTRKTRALWTHRPSEDWSCFEVVPDAPNATRSAVNMRCSPTTGFIVSLSVWMIVCAADCRSSCAKLIQKTERTRTFSSIRSYRH